jgi:nucleoside-diphosphate-sugar epimerase
VVQEDLSIDWNRSDYDPYARTKKFCEHMVRELLPDVSRTVFRPSIVLGDSRRPETTQFDMVRSFVFLAGLPVLPFRPEDRIDIVPVDYVAESVVALHQKARPEHEIYHLSSGTGAETFSQLTHALAQSAGKMQPLFWPGLEGKFSSAVNWLANSRGTAGRSASLLKVFMPYLVWDTVFDNSRVVAEMGRAPEPFSKYCYPLLRFSRDCRFSYPYKPWPGSSTAAREEAAAVAVASARGSHP